MHSIQKWSRTLVLVIAIFSARPGFGAPALTTIQDVLYKADGTRFRGTLYITWMNFQTSDSVPIPTQSITVPVTNGVLKVQLVPTTNASAGANYQVRYVSDGKFQFAETWAVPPSTVVLKIRDVRIATGVIVGPPPTQTTVAISDIAGLSSELSLRATKGAGFQPARAAVINSSGLIDGASGNPTDCVRVDGSSGSCGGAGGTSASVLTTFIDSETPSGLVDGSNATFTLAIAPSPSSSLTFFRNGLSMRQSLDYSVSGNTVVFVSGAIPQPGDVLQAFYRTGDPSNPLSAFTASQVVCGSTGGVTSGTSQTTLGTCTLPGGLLRSGDRVEIRFDLAHQGTASAFVARVAWGTTSVFTGNGASSDPTLSGRASFGLYSTGAQWTVEALKANPAVTTGVASDSFSSPIPIVISGMLSTAGSDSLSLRNFTVIRHPAQSNP